MLPQERLIEHVQTLPDGCVLCLAPLEDPVSELLRREATGQSRPFFSYQEYDRDAALQMKDVGVIWANLLEWGDGSAIRHIQQFYRNLALSAHKLAVRDAFFVFGETWQEEGWTGKGGTAVPALKALGYNVVHAAGDPDDITILRRGDLWGKFQRLREHATV